MKYEPPINREQLRATIADEYGIAVDPLTFVPAGYVAACYAARGEDGGSYFLKVWPDTRVAREGAAWREATLRLARALYDRGIYPWVPYPIPTRAGALSAQLGLNELAVFPFLPGRPAPPAVADLPLAQRDELARAIARIHRATPALSDALPRRETFDFPTEADLREGLADVERIGARARSGLRALRELVLPRRQEVLDQLDRLRDLQARVRGLSGRVVLCHTDLGGDNLLVDDEHRLYLLDWDTATLAPPEHDLQSAIGPGFGRFLEVYRAAGGAWPWHLDHFAFYLLRRHLEDFAARFLRILEEETGPEEVAENLQGMEEWGFAKWRALDETLAGVAAALPRP